jgi:predicted secreted protein
MLMQGRLRAVKCTSDGRKMWNRTRKKKSTKKKEEKKLKKKQKSFQNGLRSVMSVHTELKKSNHANTENIRILPSFLHCV